MLKRIHISWIEVDPLVQRNLNKVHVNNLVEGFNPRALGVLHVSHRETGQYFVIDGQHRLAALHQREFDGQLDVEVHEGLTPREEAALFLELNASKQVMWFDHYRLSIQAGDPRAVGIDRLLTKHGYRAAKTTAPGNATCVTSLMRLYELFPELVDRVLETHEGAWAAQYPVYGRMVNGLGLFWDQFTDASMPRLQDQLRNLSPELVQSKAGDAQRLGMDTSKSVALVLTNLYNERLRKPGRLAAWVWYD